MEQDVVSLLQRILERASLLTKKVIVPALKMATTTEALTPEHLFLSLCYLDASLVCQKLGRNRIDMKELLSSVRTHMLGEESQAATNSVLIFACEAAPFGVPITTSHLLVAILMEDTNQVSRYLKDRQVDVEALVRKRFSYILARPVVLSAGPFQSPETRARAWLCELIPRQGLSYTMSGWIELRSTLNPRRLYRIHRENRGTEIYEDGMLTANACMHTVDPSIPPTDRVLAEYFLLNGDEARYLSTANIKPSQLTMEI